MDRLKEALSLWDAVVKCIDLNGPSQGGFVTVGCCKEECRFGRI